MNFEDEPYVRVYKRKTITFKRIGWEGRTLLWHLMLEADRAGIIEIGDGDPVEALTVLIDIPEDVVSSGLSRLSSQGVTERHGTSLVITRFIEAQEATRSDKARAREYRERRRAETSRTVTTESQNVTLPSRPVTTSHDASLRADQGSAGQGKEEDPPTPDPVVTQIRARDPMALNRDRADVRELFDAWRSAVRRDGAKLGTGWGSSDADTLAEKIDSYSLGDCLLVARHAPTDGMVDGRDDEHKKPHNSIRYIFGNDDAFTRILTDAKRVASKHSGLSPIEKIRRAGELR